LLVKKIYKKKFTYSFILAL